MGCEVSFEWEDTQLKQQMWIYGSTNVILYFQKKANCTRNMLNLLLLYSHSLLVMCWELLIRHPIEEGCQSKQSVKT